MSTSKQTPPVEPSPTSSKNSLQDDSPHRVWIRHLLRKYLTKYIRDYFSHRGDRQTSPVTSEISILDDNGNTVEGQSEKNGNSSTLSRKVSKANNNGSDGEEEDSVETSLKTMISLTDLEIIEETALGDDRITYLSRILSLGVSYSITEQPDNFLQWIVKVPSRNFEERSLARMINAYQREVKFYAEILQNIQLWLELNPILFPGGESEVISLNVPHCYYASAKKPTLGNSSCKAYDFPSPEYTLILDDLRAHGYGKRHYGIGLSLVETTEAIREIAKLHSVSWAMAEHSDEKVLSWSDTLKWENLYAIQLDLIKQGLKHLRLFRIHRPQSEDRMGLLDDLLKLESKLPSILKELLEPLPPPAVTALIHMDFWTDNLLFKENHYEDEQERVPVSNAETGDGTDANQNGVPEPEHCEVDIDCMILDWQMVSLGRITHDLAVLMITSVDGGVRRECWMHCLKFYYELFEKMASLYKLTVPFSIQDLIEQYKDSCLLAVLMAVGRLDLVTSEQSTMDRFFDALKDLKDDALI